MNGDGIQFNINVDESLSEETAYEPAEVSDYLCFDSLGPRDEDTYEESQPFEYLASKMVDIIQNGKVKKRILKEGQGAIIPDLSKVTIHYNSYLEYNDEPFDSTYIRKRPFLFRLSAGETLPGIDIAVATMKPNEKAQFLVHPDYAYGKFGCPDRIPPNAQVLVEIELISFCNTGATVTYQDLDEEAKKKFAEIHKYALGLCSKGNEYFHKRNYKLACREYNMAIGKLEYCELADYGEQEKQQKLLLRLYINNSISYSMVNEPRKCCTFCNKVYYLTKGTALEIPAKVYFHNARALMKLSDFDQAKKRLLKAKAKEPHNPEIAAEFKILEEMQAKDREREKALAKAFVACAIQPESKISDKFKEVVDEICKELIDDQSSNEFKLPSQLTTEEKALVEAKAKEHGLGYKVEAPDAIFVFKK